MKRWTGWPRRLSTSAWAFDCGLALAAAAMGTILLVTNPLVRTRPGGMVALGCALVLLHTLPLAVRRLVPGVVLTLCVASGLGVVALGLPPESLVVAILVAVYSVAAYGERWVSLAGLAAAEAGAAAVQLTPGRFGAPTVVSNTLVIGAAWLLGHSVGVRRAYIARLEERTAELEQAREELASRAVTEERLRLARELHDVVAHSMSVIAVQSGVGAHVASAQPEEAAKALVTIQETSRAALEELRRLLGVLRQDSEPPGSLSPVPGLADLDDLLAEVGKVGLAVRLRVEGTPSPLPAGIDLSAYRIVQEALTNVLKHAGPARAEVRVGYGDRDLLVEVTDNGRGVDEGLESASGRRSGESDRQVRRSAGHGLIGMRERVAAFGGHLEAGPGPDGGFRVAARLPLAADRR
jgi:signal transduction histidine kinase